MYIHISTHGNLLMFWNPVCLPGWGRNHHVLSFWPCALGDNGSFACEMWSWKVVYLTSGLLLSQWSLWFLSSVLKTKRNNKTFLQCNNTNSGEHWKIAQPPGIVMSEHFVPYSRNYPYNAALWGGHIKCSWVSSFPTWCIILESEP